NGDAIAYANPDEYSSGTSPLWILPLSGNARTLTQSYARAGDLAWVRVAAQGLHYRAPEPLGPIVSADELEARAPIAQLATDGDRAAYGFCGSIGVWTPASQAIVKAAAACYEEIALQSVALSGDQVAWGLRVSGCCPTTEVLVTSVTSPGFG